MVPDLFEVKAPLSIYLERDMMIFRTIAAAASLSVLSAAGAAALTVSGFDNPGSSPTPTSVGTLDVGNNLVSGSVVGTCPSGTEFGETFRSCNVTSTFRDVFAFTVAAGTQVTSVSVGTEGFGPTGFRIKGVLFNNPGSFFGGDRDGVNEVFDALVGFLGGSALPPLQAGEYKFEVGADDKIFNAFSNEADDFEAAWGVSFGVEALTAVPLPAGAPLLLGGLSLLALARRRKHG